MSARAVPEADFADLAAVLFGGGEVGVGGLLFDMDGTLVDSVPAVEESWRNMAEEFGVAHLPAALHGLTAEAVVAAAGIHPAQHPRAIARLVEIESRSGQQLEALPGVRALVESLPTGRWGVVTSAPRPVARARYGASGLIPPEFFVTGDDVTASKPNPEPFRTGVAELVRRGLDGVVVAVEDSVAGVQSARSAGCLVVGVVGTCTQEELAPQAHLVVGSLDVLRVTTSETGLGLVMTPR